jgi:putative membrane protein insertion efficiency factor
MLNSCKQWADPANRLSRGSCGYLGLAARVVLSALHLYKRRLSHRLARTCRYVPTCSEYARLAVIKHGVLRGVWMSFRRLASCGSWSQRPPVDFP